MRIRHGRLAFVLTVLVMSSAGCSSAIPSPTASAASDGRPIWPTTRDVFRFESFPEMIATADAVVVARVVEVQPAPTSLPGVGLYRQWRVSIEIDEVLDGSAAGSALDLLVDEVFVNLQLERAGRAWWRTGVRAAFFLRQRDDGVFGPLNSHSIYVVTGHGLQPVYDGGLADTIRGWSLDELRTQVSEAAALVRTGGVTPQPMRQPGQAP